MRIVDCGIWLDRVQAEREKELRIFNHEAANPVTGAIVLPVEGTN